RRPGNDVVVGVVRRDLPQAGPEHELDAVGGLLRDCAEKARVVGAATQRPADREDPHYDSCATSVRSAGRVTSLASAGSPVGSGMFQFMSKSVRSTVVDSLRPTRFLPKWSTVGPTIVPRSVAGFVMPLIVMRPSTSTWSPSRRRVSVSNRTSGCRSASKNSGD